MGLVILVCVAVGCVIGRLAGIIFKDSENVLRNILCGIVGGLLGGLSVYIVGLATYSWFFEILNAVLGASIFIFVIRATEKKRR